MEFIKEMNIHMTEGDGFVAYDSIRINDEIALSVQGSKYHYCHPRETIDIDKYKKLELAISGFVSVADVTDNELLIRKFDEYYDGMIHAYVPVELIEELYQDLKAKHKEVPII